MASKTLNSDKQKGRGKIGAKPTPLAARFTKQKKKFNPFCRPERKFSKFRP